MTYNPNIPQAGDIISQSQGDILTNFQELNLVYGDTNPPLDPNSDHFPYNDTSLNSRKHRKVRLPDTSASPYTPLASEGVMYAITDGDSQTYPFWRRDVGTTDYPMLPIKIFGECTVPGAVLQANSFNLSGVTRLGVGRYRFDFAETLPDVNYSVLCALASSGTSPIISYDGTSKLTTSIVIQLLRQGGSGFTDDASLISLTILRN